MFLLILCGAAWAQTAPSDGVPFFERLNLPAHARPSLFERKEKSITALHLDRPQYQAGPARGLFDSDYAIDRTWLGHAVKRGVGQLEIRQEHSEPIRYLKSKVDVPDAWEDDLGFRPRNWKADEQLRLTLPDVKNLYVFGQFKGYGDLNRNDKAEVTGKSGVGVKWNVNLLTETEMQVRTGRQLYVADTSTATPLAWANSQLLFEFLARVPIYQGIDLEYTGSALGANTITNRDSIIQDLRLNLPIGKRNELYLGATLRLDGQPGPTPWTDRGEIYFGLTIKR